MSSNHFLLIKIQDGLICSINSCNLCTYKCNYNSNWSVLCTGNGWGAVQAVLPWQGCAGAHPWGAPQSPGSPGQHHPGLSTGTLGLLAAPNVTVPAGQGLSVAPVGGFWRRGTTSLLQCLPLAPCLDLE